jgi:PTS system glucitol/sorbitol-specific IIA component
MSDYIHKTVITGIGSDAAEFLEENMLILFGKNAPPELAPYCYLHDSGEGSVVIHVGDVLMIDGEACPITAIGEEALRTFRELGHMTVKFDGAAEAAQPGVMHVRHDGVPPIVVGSVFAFQKGEKDRKHHIFKLFQKGRKNL